MDNQDLFWLIAGTTMIMWTVLAIIPMLFLSKPVYVRIGEFNIYYKWRWSRGEYQLSCFSDDFDGGIIAETASNTYTRYPCNTIWYKTVKYVAFAFTVASFGFLIAINVL